MGDRAAVLENLREPPLIAAVILQSYSFLHFHDLLLKGSTTCEIL